MLGGCILQGAKYFGLELATLTGALPAVNGTIHMLEVKCFLDWGHSTQSLGGSGPYCAVGKHSDTLVMGMV